MAFFFSTHALNPDLLILVAQCFWFLGLDFLCFSSFGRFITATLMVATVERAQLPKWLKLFARSTPGGVGAEQISRSSFPRSKFFSPTEQWPVRVTVEPSESILVRRTRASVSGNTIALRSSPTTKATERRRLVSLSPTLSGWSVTRLRNQVAMNPVNTVFGLVSSCSRFVHGRSLLRCLLFPGALELPAPSSVAGSRHCSSDMPRRFDLDGIHHFCCQFCCSAVVWSLICDLP